MKPPIRCWAQATALLVALGTAQAEVPSAVSTAATEVQTVSLWHTFATDSLEEAILERSVAAFEAEHPAVLVEITRIPYLQNLPQFINSSQGGEAPDVIRFSDSELGKVGHISVEGLPLLEDLRPHLTPMERAAYDPRALAAMRYGEPLYALPVSQGCLTLVYNRGIFDAAGVAYPRDDWTTEELLSAAKRLHRDGMLGLSLPLKWSYWFIPFQSGFGGQLFTSDGAPTLDSPGSARAVDWFLDLERQHDVVASSANLEAMSATFMLGDAAMVLDGPWNVNSYRAEGLDVGLALMPTVSETGLRMAPMLSYFGWAVSKQSTVKLAAVALSRWLTSAEVQRAYALETNMIPVNRTLLNDPEIQGNPVLSAYARQTLHGTWAPTNRATSMLFEQLDTALEMTYTGKMGAQEALEAANRELLRRLSL